MSAKEKTGTREWAELTKNIQLGCEAACLYCYARANAVRFKRCAAAAWCSPRPRPFPRVTKFAGRVMFPSAHDITPLNIDRCEEYLARLLESGRQVVIVTKPHYSCVTRLLDSLEPWRSRVIWRMTIGSRSKSTLAFWEPAAPGFAERLSCLDLAHARGWQTSVSMEPILDIHPDQVISRVRHFVTESIWLGLMRDAKRRLTLNLRGLGAGLEAAAAEAARQLAEAWTDEAVLRLVDYYKRDPLVRWKDSIRKVMERSS